MAKRKQSKGISPIGKIALLAVLFGIPCIFALSSWGLAKVYEIAPWALIIIMLIVCTAYTAYTAGLMYSFYDVDPPVMRWIPCVGELSLIDVKYHAPCYILYALTVIFALATQLPYSVVGKLGADFATRAPFYFLLIALIFAFAIQVIKGIGIMGCMKDVGEDWRKQTHADVGAISKFTPLGFVPFVRVMALYALNKPLSTMVSFMGLTSSDAVEEASFVEEEDEF